MKCLMPLFFVLLFSFSSCSYADTCTRSYRCLGLEYEEKLAHVGYFGCYFDRNEAEKYIVKYIEEQCYMYRIQQVSPRFCPEGSWEYVVTYKCVSRPIE